MSTTDAKGEIFEIGRFLHLKSEIRNCKLDCPICDFEISDLRWAFVRFQNFSLSNHKVCCCPLLGGNISRLYVYVVAINMNSGSCMIPTICSISFERTRSTET